MVRLNRTKARKLLAQICQIDAALCSYIKRLVQLKRTGNLSTHYAQGDLNKVIITIVADGITIGHLMQSQCDPNNPYECDLG